MRAIVTLLLIAVTTLIHAQEKTNVEYYNGGMKYAERGNYKEAITYFDMAIKLKPDDYFSMHNRGIAKSLMKDYPAAIEDFKMVLSIKPDYTDAKIALGSSYRYLTHYDTAAAWYSNVLNTEPSNSKVLYFRALSYEAMNMIDSAAADFKKSFELGATQLEKQVEYYEDTTKSYIVDWHTVGKVTEVSTDPTYGFSQKNPVKVGTQKGGGGFPNMQAYLDQLKDERRKPVQYQRIKACCTYRPKGFKNNVLMHEYQITYNTLREGTKTATIYLTYYEYEKPKILMGFKPTHR